MDKPVAVAETHLEGVGEVFQRCLFVVDDIGCRVGGLAHFLDIDVDRRVGSEIRGVYLAYEEPRHRECFFDGLLGGIFLGLVNFLVGGGYAVVVVTLFYRFLFRIAGDQQ